MAIKYRLHFQSLETGCAWRGKPVFNTYEMADFTRKELKKECPYVACWVRGVEVEERPIWDDVEDLLANGE